MDMNTKPLHQAFTWLDNGAESAINASFVEITHDVAMGMSTLLDVLVTCQMADTADVTGQRPMLGVQDRENLLLFARASAVLLQKQADREIDRLNDLPAKARCACTMAAEVPA